MEHERIVQTVEVISPGGARVIVQYDSKIDGGGKCEYKLKGKVVWTEYADPKPISAGTAAVKCE